MALLPPLVWLVTWHACALYMAAPLPPVCEQERDPRAYQVALRMPSGACFVSSTPECLYSRTGRDVASEAVAGTRGRGAGGAPRACRHARAQQQQPAARGRGSIPLSAKSNQAAESSC